MFKGLVNWFSNLLKPVVEQAVIDFVKSKIQELLTSKEDREKIVAIVKTEVQQKFGEEIMKKSQSVILKEIKKASKVSNI